MFKTSMINNNTEFAGYKVVRKLSRHHDGEREVYLVTDSEGRNVALTVFNIKCWRYATDRSARKRHPDFMEEVRFDIRMLWDSRNILVVGLALTVITGTDGWLRNISMAIVLT